MAAILKNRLKTCLMALSAVCGVWSSCSSDNHRQNEVVQSPVVPDDGDDGDVEGSAANCRLVLRISPVSRASADETAAVTEKIKSLRVVVVSRAEEADKTAETRIECNRLITAAEFGVTAASGFRYEILLLTTKGKKDIYLIANEESIGDIAYNLPEGSTLNAAALPTTFKGLMERYQPAADTQEGENPDPDMQEGPEGDTAAPDPAEFGEVVNAVYFQPEYKPVGGEIYLPYVSAYTVEAKADENNIHTMYLVPVATKFTFHFVNRRTDAVDVRKIEVSSIDSHNYLLARVGGDDVTKRLDDKEMYWVDWLAAVSELSHNVPGFSENMDFNKLFGWISDYEVPAPTEDYKPQPVVLVDETANKKVPAGIIHADDTETPGVLVLGPYYLPESRCEEEFEVKGKDEQGNDVTTKEKMQVYRLTMNLSDSKGHSPSFDKVVISNLQALFRNTSVTIKVNMSQDDVAVYAEISEWNFKSSNGWVIEGDDSGMIPDPSQNGDEN